MEKHEDGGVGIAIGPDGAAATPRESLLFPHDVSRVLDASLSHSVLVIVAEQHRAGRH